MLVLFYKIITLIKPPLSLIYLDIAFVSPSHANGQLCFLPMRSCGFILSNKGHISYWFRPQNENRSLILCSTFPNPPKTRQIDIDYVMPCRYYVTCVQKTIITIWPENRPMHYSSDVKANYMWKDRFESGTNLNIPDDDFYFAILKSLCNNCNQ